METTPQNTQPQGNESQRIKTCPEGQDKLVLKSSDLKAQFIAIPHLLAQFGVLFGNTNLIAKCKAEMACIQEELLKKPQEAEPQLDFNSVDLMTDIQEILVSDYWIENVYIAYPSDMQVDWNGCEISISDVEGEVEVRMNQGNSEIMAEKIMDFLGKRAKHA